MRRPHNIYYSLRPFFSLVFFFLFSFIHLTLRQLLFSLDVYVHVKSETNYPILYKCISEMYQHGEFRAKFIRERLKW